MSCCRMRVAGRLCSSVGYDSQPAIERPGLESQHNAKRLFCCHIFFHLNMLKISCKICNCI